MQHVFSHQQQFPSETWSSQVPHHPNIHHASNSNPHPQHFNRIAGGNANGNGASTVNNNEPANFTPDNMSSNGSGATNPANNAVPSAEERRVLQWIAQLMDPKTREGALLELSKKREQFPQLALILWHSFGKRRSRQALRNKRERILFLHD